MCFRSVCNYCPNLDQVPNVILDQIPQKELDQSTVDQNVEFFLRFREIHAQKMSKEKVSQGNVRNDHLILGCCSVSKVFSFLFICVLVFLY